MGRRYDIEERIFGGSMTPRLNPKIARTELNTRIGGQFPSPVARATTQTGAIPEGDSGRRARVGLPDRMRKY